jgi:hypothetical protein
MFGYVGVENVADLSPDFDQGLAASNCTGCTIGHLNLYMPSKFSLGLLSGARSPVRRAHGPGWAAETAAV